MEFIKKESMMIYYNPGVESKQLLCEKNSSSKRVTLTEVHLEPGAVQQRHSHPASEQIWYAISGSGVLLLDHDTEVNFSAGDVVRFSENEIHGLRNSDNAEFVYLSVTAPPVNFRNAYEGEK